MVNRAQLDAVRTRIEELETERFLPENGWMRPSHAPESVPWDSLTEIEQLDVLCASVDWNGFSVAEQVDVSHRVVEGEASEFWMDGVTVSDGREAFAALAAEIREDELAARVRDYGQEDATTFDWMLHKAAETGYTHANDNDKGIDR